MSNKSFTGNVIRFLEESLQDSRPGLDAQLTMITNPRPGNRTYSEVEDSCHKAGVLVLLYPVKNRLHLVFTRRTARVDFHQAQISFPGGRKEPEESLKEAALREAEEELNIVSSSVRIIGELTPLYIPPSNYCVYPVVAVTDKRPDFQPSPEEVEEVIEVPLDHLLDPQNIRREVWQYKGREIEVPFFFFRGHKIWGATAMMLAELIELLKGFLDKQN
ncbi:MAG: CoA pyrophosphatase [Candidatus Aminicenantes bacterium]|nr:CoA pyrophosphatase [Candidatus Aminicenantes bacterium]